jgi:hypothetical protein
MDIDTATGQPAQDISSRIESALFPSEEAVVEPDGDHDDVALEDEGTLPKSDETESEDEDGSDLEETELTDEEQSLADYLGIPDERINVAKDGTVTFTAIIDGQSKEVPLKELAASFQLQGHVNNKSIALENERKEFYEQKNQVAQELQTRINNLDGMAKLAEEQLVGDFNRIDWDRLRHENPSEWSALRQEYAEKAQSIQQMQAQIHEQGSRLLKEQQSVFQQKHQEHLQSEMQKMVAKNPTWTDETVRNKDLTGMRDFVMGTYGFSKEDMNAVTDHRLIDLIKDAKAFREGKKAAETKIAKPVPKFQKPGATKAQVSAAANARNVKAKRDAVRKTGNTQDVANLLLDRM